MTYFCGYTHETKKEYDEPAHNEESLRNRNSIVVPKTLLLGEFERFVAAQGKIYYNTKDGLLFEFGPRSKTSKQVGDEFFGKKGRVVQMLYVEPVYEEILLVTSRTDCNVEQQEIIKLKTGGGDFNEEEDVFHFQLTEELIHIAGTDEFGFLLTSDGKIWMIEQWRSKMCTWSIKPVPTACPIIQMSSGKEHIVALTRDGCILTMGSSTRGQLGLGSTQSRDTFTKVENLEPLKFVKVIAGGWHSLVLSDSGDIYGWGWNESGQIGSCLDDSIQNNKEITKENIQKLIFLPALLDTPMDISFTNIYAGSRHSVAITTTGDVYTWGWNGYGQLGHGDQQDKVIPTLVSYFGKHESKKIIDLQCGFWSTVFVT